ncbi:hypothetical protein FVEN_g8922 [Fusarium venenatum]|nr:hypothetical protein FVEN_g8922 [Fusarium venenatum]
MLGMDYENSSIEKQAWAIRACRLFSYHNVHNPANTQHGLRLRLLLAINTAPRDPYHDLRTSPTGGQGYVSHEL